MMATAESDGSGASSPLSPHNGQLSASQPLMQHVQDQPVSQLAISQAYSQLSPGELRRTMMDEFLDLLEMMQEELQAWKEDPECEFVPLPFASPPSSTAPLLPPPRSPSTTTTPTANGRDSFENHDPPGSPKRKRDSDIEEGVPDEAGDRSCIDEMDVITGSQKDPQRCNTVGATKDDQILATRRKLPRTSPDHDRDELPGEEQATRTSTL